MRRFWLPYFQAYARVCRLAGPLLFSCQVRVTKKHASAKRTQVSNRLARSASQNWVGPQARAKRNTCHGLARLKDTGAGRRSNCAKAESATGPVTQISTNANSVPV